MKKKIAILVLLICTLLVSACGEDNTVELEKEFISRTYGEWIKVNSASASSNGQTINSEDGVILSNTFNVSISVQWRELIEASFGYDFTIEELKSTGTSKEIDKNQVIEFYIRPVYELYNIEKTDKNGKKESIEFTSLVGPQWGWIIYDENNKIIENTLEESVTETKQNDVGDMIEKYIVRSEKEIISIPEIEELSDEELYLMRNGIFAYCGREFLEKELEEYFLQYEWYEPSISRDDFKWNMLNHYQQKNVENISKIEKSRMH